MTESDNVYSYSNVYSSFGMAHSFVDSIGDVDVISDAEVINKNILNPFTPSTGQSKNSRKIPNFIFPNPAKQNTLLVVPCESTAKENSFEWSHHRISSTDSKVRTTLHVSIIDCGSQRV